MKRLIFLLLTTLMLSMGSNHAGAVLLITQYYEGASNDKFIEVTNTGTVSLDISSFALVLYSNANRENYKSGGTHNANFGLAGTLAAGESYIVKHGSAANPSYATSYTPNATDSTVANFNGDDSIALYSSTSTFTVANLVDAFGVTSGAGDRSVYRTSLAQGYSLTAGSDYTDFGDVWVTASLSDVANAAAGTDVRLGFSSLAVPEPTGTVLFGIAGLGAMLIRRRRIA